MNKLALLLLLFPYFLAAQTWKHTPNTPKAGETVKVEFDLTNSKMNAVENIGIYALEYVNNKAHAVEVATLRTGNKLTGILDINAAAKAVVLILNNLDDNEPKDNNGGDGYAIPLFDANGKQLPENFAAQAILYREWGGLLGLNRLPVKAIELQEKAFADQPDLKKKYWSSYANNLMAAKRGGEGQKNILNLLTEVEANAEADENDLLNAIKFYDKIGLADKTKAIKENIRQKWPKGQLFQQEQRKKIEMEPDLAKGEELLAAYITQFPPQTDDEKNQIVQLRSAIANKYGDQQNWDKFRSIAAQLPESDRASLYNNFAWELAEKGEAIDEASVMAATATQIARKEIANPSSPKMAYMTEKAAEKLRKQFFTMYADTYAYILDKKGDAKGAADLQAEVIAANKGDDPEMNERYVAYLERSAAPDLRYQLEGFLIKGKSTSKMKEQFKKLYLAEDHSEAGFTTYLSKLESAAKAERQREILQKMVNDPAPAFSLKNLKGETVSLESLRGKVVVLDFWATWCGPCKASFPGMQKAVEFYKNDPNVAFLFMDSWEKAEDKLKNANDFITGKGYTFNVLLDTDDKVITSFGVSGIPTKFILDRAGKIRFKTTGFDGSDDGLVEEMKIMIDTAKAQQ